MPKPKKKGFDAPSAAGSSDENARLDFFVPETESPVGPASKAHQAWRKHEESLFAIDGVEGVSVESDEIGEDIIIVFTRDESVRERIPATLEDVPVRVEVSGEFDAFG